MSEEQYSVGEAVKFGRIVTSDLEKVREIIYWGLLIVVFWFWAVYATLKEVFSGEVKKTDTKFAAKEA